MRAAPPRGQVVLEDLQRESLQRRPLSVVITRQVVDDLPDHPVPVACLQLFRGEARHRFAHGRRRLVNDSDELATPLQVVALFLDKYSRWLLRRLPLDLTLRR